jgi:hypothetical protein
VKNGSSSSSSSSSSRVQQVIMDRTHQPGMSGGHRGDKNCSPAAKAAAAAVASFTLVMLLMSAAKQLNWLPAKEKRT